ncbi:NYN domain limkain-b1-type [Arabidopsis suecica]|uniref:NYN domain limkain-b1-type n=1 Tax=Arabidopsis suecica TaxID=45249 RepID=A0A8T1ZWE3_ARASU|nr:NYN domain limkain-b1-type [Arabidopsis suecica]
MGDDDRETYYAKRFKDAETIVFWDVNDCGIPDGYKAVGVSNNIRSVLTEMNYLGPVTIYAYGDRKHIVDNLEPTAIEKTQDEKTSIYADADQKSPAIVFNHTTGDRTERLELILLDMFIQAIENRSRANFMLIVGDISQNSEVAFGMNRLHMAGNNILLAQPEDEPSLETLPGDTNSVWESLSIGESRRIKRRYKPSNPRDYTCLGGSRYYGFLLVGALVVFTFTFASPRRI